MMKATKRIKWLDVTIITIVHHIHDIYTFFLPALQTVIQQTYGLSYQMFGAMLVFQRVPTLLNPFLGILAERIRMRFLMILAPLVTSISMCLILDAPNFLTLCILAFVSGLSSSMFHVPTPVMMKHVSGEYSGVGMSFYMFGGNSARMLAPVLVIASIDLWALGGLLKLIPAGALASLILYIRYRKTDIRKDFHHTKSEGSYWKVIQSFKNLLLVILFFTLLNGVLKSCINSYLTGFLEEQGYNQKIAKLGLSVVYLSGAIGALASGTLSDYVGKRTTVALASLVAPFCMIGFLNTEGYMQFVMLFLTGFFILSPVPVFLSIVNGLKSKHLPFLNGLYMTINFAGSATSTYVLGWWIDMWQYDLAYYIALFAAFGAVPLAFLLPKK